MAQLGGSVRRSLGGVAAVILALTLSACGDGWDVPEPPEVTSSASSTPPEVQGPTAGSTEPPGHGEAPVEEVAPYEGWASLSEVVEGLGGLGIVCEELPDQLALCEPAAVVAFGISTDSFEAALNTLQDEVPEYRIVADGDWIMACEAAFTGACQQVSEYTGISMTRMN